ncbi:FtsX-like permease family protein [Streptomyces avicenniae]|uniref:FtsX-like permease family protein n=1 Tax=Streptomyces avicenniae TaxID=500153 RepID=UPI00069C8D4A|nr:ABC transporter permease [Streptomyces avicenniae]
MFMLAMRSVRRRPGRFAGTLLSAFLGAVITMAFNSMHDTAGGAGVDDSSAETLGLSGGVVGGYSTLLVFFAVASTLTVNVRQRTDEISLLRSTGATPAQIKRMVTGEAAVIALVAAILAIVPAMLAGNALLEMFKDTDQVAAGVDYVFGPIALGAGFGITLLASAGAAYLAVRRATRAAAGERAPRARMRTIGGTLALLAGIGGISSTFAMEGDEPVLMMGPAYGAILLSVGFAAFSTGLLRALLVLVARPLGLLTGGSGYLAVNALRRRAEHQAGILMPLILFTGIGFATLCIQAVESAAIDASGLVKSVEDKNVETLNTIVVGIIVAFCCVMLINSLYAATSYRVKEFGGQRLAGATPRQVVGGVGVEAALLTVTGVLFGTLAGYAGLLAFVSVRTGAEMPGSGPLIWAGIVVVGAAATMLTTLLTARRALRVPAVVAVA